MSDAGPREKFASKTPRVDHAERLIYAHMREPVGFVLSSVAKLLEIELNQALAELKAARHANPVSALQQTQANSTSPSEVIEPAKFSDVVQDVKVPAPSAKAILAEPSVMKAGVAAHVDESGPRPQVIEPTIRPEGAGESVEYDDGQILFNKGDNAERLVIVLEGSVEIFDPVGNISLAILGAGSSFGEQAILEGGIRDASVKASGKVKCLEINTDAFRTQLIKDTGLLLQTIEGLLLQLSMCNQISKMIETSDADLVYQLLGDESLTSLKLQDKLNDAYNNPGTHGLSAEQMMYLKLQSSEKLFSDWIEAGKELGSPTGEYLGSAYVIIEGSVNASFGDRTIRLGHGSVLGLAEGITGKPFSWTLVANEHLTVKTISIDKVLRGLEHSNPGIRGIVRYTSSRILELQKLIAS